VKTKSEVVVPRFFFILKNLLTKTDSSYAEHFNHPSGGDAFFGALIDTTKY